MGRRHRRVKDWQRIRERKNASRYPTVKVYGTKNQPPLPKLVHGTPEKAGEYRKKLRRIIFQTQFARVLKHWKSKYPRVDEKIISDSIFLNSKKRD